MATLVALVSSIASGGPLIALALLGAVLILVGLIVYIVQKTGSTAGLRDLAELVRAFRCR